MTTVKKYHVHIYKVIKKMEVDTLAYNEVKAKEIALDAAKDGILEEKDSDCSFIAMEFEIEEKGDK